MIDSLGAQMFKQIGTCSRQPKENDVPWNLPRPITHRESTNHIRRKLQRLPQEVTGPSSAPPLRTLPTLLSDPDTESGLASGDLSRGLRLRLGVILEILVYC